MPGSRRTVRGVHRHDPALGSIVRQAIRNDNVTRKYQDLKLHIETAEWLRRRVLGLLEKAEKIEDIIKLEEELLRLTAAIEGLPGHAAGPLGADRLFQGRGVLLPAEPGIEDGPARAPEPLCLDQPRRAEQMTAGFGPVESADDSGASKAWARAAGGVLVGPLEGFLVFKRDRDELKAITPDASELWVREFAVSRAKF